jgi:hypothetical protein
LAFVVALVAMAGGPVFARGGGRGGGGGGGGGGRSFSSFGGGHSYGGGWGGARSLGSAGSFRAAPALSSGSFATSRSFAQPGVVGANNLGAHAWSSGAWNHAGNLSNWGHNGWWNHNWAGRGFGYGYYGSGIGPYWGYGLYGGYWNPWWYTGAYPYYGYDSYYPYYAYDNADYGYPVGADDSTIYATQPVATSTEDTATQDFNAPDVNEPTAGAAGGQQYADEALEAFQQGNYRDALRLGSHAAIETPRNARVHELLSLALFALKDYRAAAMEAHAAVALGPISDWDHLYSYYGNVDTYTKQLDALQEYARANPSSADARFLLGYHDLMMGHTQEGKALLTQAISLAPKDKVARQLLQQTGATAVTAGMPPTSGETQTPSSGETQTPSSVQPQAEPSQQPTISRGRVY